MSIDDKLEALERARAELEAKIRESEEILRDINEKMDDLQDRQRIRMRADDRVDNEVVDAIHSQEINKSALTELSRRKQITQPLARPGFGKEFDTGPLIKDVLTPKDVHVERRPNDSDESQKE